MAKMFKHEGAPEKWDYYSQYPTLIYKALCYYWKFPGKFAEELTPRPCATIAGCRNIKKFY